MESLLIWKYHLLCIGGAMKTVNHLYCSYDHGSAHPRKASTPFNNIIIIKLLLNDLRSVVTKCSAVPSPINSLIRYRVLFNPSNYTGHHSTSLQRLFTQRFRGFHNTHILINSFFSVRRRYPLPIMKLITQVM